MLHGPSTSRGWLFSVSMILLSASALSESAVLISRPASAPSASPAIVIGFVGGFVRHDNINQGPVQLAQRIRLSAPKDTFVRMFENRHRKSAYRAILRALDTNRDGVLSAQEKHAARIVLFGHSWGAAAAVALARDLQRSGIPVLLTAQVDSVAKLWQNDSVIPGNVAEAVNYYQPHGLIHGQPHITAADPARTQILGNYLMDYRKDPVPCSASSWFDHITPSHAQSECDTRLWTKIEDLLSHSLGWSSSAAHAGLQTDPVTH